MNRLLTTIVQLFLAGTVFILFRMIVANVKRRFARNKKRFAKVNCDPEQDSKLSQILDVGLIHRLWKTFKY